jgi:hypothetical protein
VHIVDDEFTGDPDLLEAIQGLGYQSSAHAVLHRSVFPPPSVVADVGTRAIVNAVRRGTFDGLARVERFAFLPPEHVQRLFGLTAHDPLARGVYVDDNACAHFALATCFSVGREIASTQVCHIFPREFSQHPMYFTALPNLVLVPAWLAKLTDSDPAVTATLRWA